MSRQRVMWDLCCGLKGASAAFEARGWRVVSVDIDPTFRPTILADILDFRPRGVERPDFVWGSPVCTEYALRRFDPSIVPSLNMVLQVRRVIRDLGAPLWAMENVRHSVPYISSLLGPHRMSVGPFFLWGNFPKFLARPVAGKGAPGGPHWLRGATRAKIPLTLSEDMEAAVSYLLEQQEAARRREQEPASSPLSGLEQGPALDRKQGPSDVATQGAA